MSRSLLIETSGRVGRVGLADGVIVSQIDLDPVRRHGRDLAPTIQRQMELQHWRPADLGLIALSLGPGSFTGLRVGLATAKAICFGSGARLVGVPTFELIAAQVNMAVPACWIVADGHQDKLFVQRFERRDGTLQSMTAIEIWTGEDRMRLGNGDAVFTPGRSATWGAFAEGWVVIEPDLESLLQIAGRRNEKKEFDDPWIVEPIYVRASAAEEKRSADQR